MNLSPETTVILAGASIVAVAYFIMLFALKVQAEDREEKEREKEHTEAFQ